MLIRPVSPSGRGIARHFSQLWRALWALAIGLGLAPLCVADAHATLTVHAQVLPVARIQVDARAPLIFVSAADVAAGYVDAPRAWRVRVESNSRAGYALDVFVLAPWCTSVALHGLDAEVVLDTGGGTVVQRWSDKRFQALELQVRFKLAPDVQPGSYAWPLQLAARPI